jgi:signal peptidase I
MRQPEQPEAVSPGGAPSASALHRFGAAARTLAGVVSAAVGAAALQRFLVPSRLQATRGGVASAAARFAEEHPLLTFVMLFVAVAELGRYWWRRTPWASGRDRPVARPRAQTMVLVCALFAAIVLIGRGSLVALARVNGPSMLPTLETGDQLLVNRTAYGVALPFARRDARARTPARGDLVVFRGTGLPGVSGAQDMVKRVVGIPGDTMSFDQGGMLINGWRVPSCDVGPYAYVNGRGTVRGRLAVEYLAERAYLTVRKAFERPSPSYTVKPGEVYVAGDDRGLSNDSRAWTEANGVGVPIESLTGRVERVLAGASPDGGVDLSRLLARTLSEEVRLPGVDLTQTRNRILECLQKRPAQTWPPAPALL